MPPRAPTRLGLLREAAGIEARLLLAGLGGSRYFEYPWVLGRLDPIEHRRVLDVGCGPSVLPALLARRGHEVLASDYDPAELTRQVERLARRERGAGRLAVAALDATHLAVADGAFDAAICLSVLEHLPAPGDAAAVAEMGRALRPGGLLLVTLPFGPAYREATPPYRSGAHQRVYDEATLRDRFAGVAGLELLSVGYVGPGSAALLRVFAALDRYRPARLGFRWLFLAAPPAVVGWLTSAARSRAGLACLALRRTSGRISV